MFFFLNFSYSLLGLVVQSNWVVPNNQKWWKIILAFKFTKSISCWIKSITW